MLSVFLAVGDDMHVNQCWDTTVCLGGFGGGGDGGTWWSVDSGPGCFSLFQTAWRIWCAHTVVVHWTWFVYATSADFHVEITQHQMWELNADINVKLPAGRRDCLLNVSECVKKKAKHGADLDIRHCALKLSRIQRYKLLVISCDIVILWRKTTEGEMGIQYTFA